MRILYTILLFACFSSIISSCSDENNENVLVFHAKFLDATPGMSTVNPDFETQNRIILSFSNNFENEVTEKDSIAKSVAANKRSDEYWLTINNSTAYIKTVTILSGDSIFRTYHITEHKFAPLGITVVQGFNVEIKEDGIYIDGTKSLPLLDYSAKIIKEGEPTYEAFTNKESVYEDSFTCIKNNKEMILSNDERKYRFIMNENGGILTQLEPEEKTIGELDRQ